MCNFVCENARCVDNEIAEAKDEADLAQTKEQLFEQLQEILLDDLDVKSKVGKLPPIVTAGERVPDYSTTEYRWISKPSTTPKRIFFYILNHKQVE